jgi:hypothetical protein
MSPTAPSLRTGLRATTAAALAGAGLAFAAYPALRPYSDEASLAGARAMASGAWVAAHLLGMAGFVALTLGLWGLGALRSVASRRATAAALALAWLGAGLVLPYYGAETFGLQVIAERAAADRDAALLELAETFRYGAVPLVLFGTGLLLLSAAGVALAVAVRRSARLVRAGGFLVGLGLTTYLPQFFLTPGLRVAHGLVLGAGLLALAVGVLRTPDGTGGPSGLAAEAPMAASEGMGAVGGFSYRQ